MCKKLFLIFSMMVVFFTMLANIGSILVVRIENPSQDLVKYFADQQYDILSYVPNSFIDLIITEKNKDYFSKKQIDYSVIATEETIKGNLILRTSERTGYRTYTEMYNELVDIEQNYPNLAKLYNIGDSWGKIYYEQGIEYYEQFQHSIWALKLTLNPEEIHDRPAVYYMGALHAREPLSVEVPMEFLNFLIDNYENDPEINYLVNNTEIWFIPMMNPDGHKIVVDQTNVWWRKNIRDNNNNQQFDHSNWGSGIDGVDLNRNFSFYWSHNTNMNAATYSGPYAFSEPETSALENLVNNSHFLTGISYHTHGQMVLYPYGYANNIYAPDVDVFSNLAYDLAMSIPKINSAGFYDPMPAWQLYPAFGTSEDYLYGVHGIIAFTIEMANQFIPPYSVAYQIAQDNLEACLILLNRVHKSLIKGLVTDNFTGEPIIAEVFVEDIDDTGEFRHPIESRLPFGRFYRLLEPNNYNLIFEADGYLPVYLTDIQVNETEVTYEDIELQQAAPHNLFILVEPGAVELNWNMPFPTTPLGFNIYRNDLLINSTLIEITNFTDSDIIVGSTYTYNVTAVYEDYGESGFSETVEITVPEQIMYGDVNRDGIITPLDASIIVQYFIGFDPIPEIDPLPWSDFSLQIADVDLDGNVLPLDAAYVLQFYVGYINELPVNTRIDPNQEANVNVTYDSGLLDFYSYGEIMGLGVKIFTADLSYLGKPVIHMKNTVYAFSVEEDFYKLGLAFMDSPKNGEKIFSLPVFTENFNRAEVIMYINDRNPEHRDLDFLSVNEVLVEQENEISFKTYPNPFNPDINMELFLVNDETYCEISVYCIRGRLVKTVFKGELSRGNHIFNWDGRDSYGKKLPSGVYYLKTEINNKPNVQKVLLLK